MFGCGCGCDCNRCYSNSYWKSSLHIPVVDCLDYVCDECMYNKRYIFKTYNSTIIKRLKELNIFEKPMHPYGS